MQKAKIIVAVRKRPLFQKEKSKGCNDIIGVHNGNQVVVSEMKQKVDLTKYIEESVFNFDHAFNQHNTNEQIYNEIMSPLMDSAFEGAKVSCFAYGQTGSGKTYTMNGVMSKNLPGLYTLGAYDIFERLTLPQHSHLTAYLSFYEIYCTKLFDLLNKRNQLILREDAKSNINVVGLSEMPISNVQQFQNYLKVGSSQRVTSENSANSESSRSHAILQISLKNGKKGFGKIYFIDLAGNQRGADHMNMKKQTQIDGQQINKSLLQLKECIRGLDQGKNHVPFRGSKLTMCLKDSFIGFCRTVMIGNISPSSGSSQNTLNTLRYADRVKELKNSDEIPKDQLKSRQMMLPRGNKNAIKIAISNSDDEDDIAQKKRKALQQYGIKHQQKRDDKRTVSLKEDNLNSDRRLSMGTSLKNPQLKGNSLAKNVLTNNLNKQVPVKAVQPKKSTVGPKKEVTTPRQQVPEYVPRHGSNQNHMDAQRFRNEPMQVQRHGNSVDMRKNLSGIVNYERNQNFQQNNSNLLGHHHNQSYNEYNNGQQSPYNNQQNLYQNSQNPTYKANNFFSNNPQNQPVQQINNNRQMNNPMNSYNSNINNSNMQPHHSNMQSHHSSMQPHNSNMQTYNNMQVHNQHPSQYGNQGYRPPQQQAPFEESRMSLPTKQSIINQSPPQIQSWNQMVDCITTTRDNSLKYQLRERLNSNLFEEQNQLIDIHNSTLQNQIQKIKSQMEFINLIRRDRSQLSSRQYSQIMIDSIDEKIGQLEELREKVTTFTYKLDDMDAIEETLEQHRRENPGEDEQLLDDFQ